MEIEQRQIQLIQELVQQASTLTGSSLVSLIVEATSHPSLFSFSEILSLPNLLQLEGTESSAYLSLLRQFAYGTWRDYKSNSGTLPQLIPEQVLKLKQLTVLTLAESNKVLSYDVLLKELEVSNVRELEDFLINECMYTALVKGKLNQVRRCFEVQFAAGRDMMHGQFGSMIDTLDKWQATSQNLLSLIQEKIGWANMMYQKDKNHQKEVEYTIDAVKRGLPFEKSNHKEGHNFWAHDSFFNNDGTMLHSEDHIRSKSHSSLPNFSGQSRAEYF